jgi:hypothetical protein
VTFPEVPRALIYDDSRFNQYVGEAQRGVELAGWQPLPFTKLDYALEELDTSVNALVVALSSDLSKTPFKGMDLLVLAAQLELPRALITASKFGEIWIRQDGPDLVIPKGRQAQIATKISRWLRRLSAEDLKT